MQGTIHKSNRYILVSSSGPGFFLQTCPECLYSPFLKAVARWMVWRTVNVCDIFPFEERLEYLAIYGLTNVHHSCQLILQCKDYKPKEAVVKARKVLRVQRPDMFISEDLIQRRVKLLYTTRTLKRQHKIMHCWSHDGRIVIKNVQGKINTIKSEDDLQKTINTCCAQCTASS